MRTSETVTSRDGQEPVLPLSILVLFIGVVGIGTWVRSATSEWPGGKLKEFQSPVVAMQFVQSVEQVKTVVGSGRDAPGRAELRSSLYRDFCLIGVYTAYLLALALLLARSGHTWSLWAAGIAAVCTIGAAGADTTENVFTLKVLDATNGETASLLPSLRLAAFSKWALLFLVTGLFCCLPFARPGAFRPQSAWPLIQSMRKWVVVLICLAAATAGFFGLAEHSWLETAAGMMIVAWAAIALFVFWAWLDLSPQHTTAKTFRWKWLLRRQ